MIFKCQNCGGNVVYSPEKKAMYCPHCEGIESQNKTGEDVGEVCANCGAPLQPGEYTSASKCEHCGCYVIFDGKVQGAYEPNLIIPFQVGKEAAKDILKKEFKKRPFTPSGFLSEAALEKMEGIYVPFWLYDYIADCSFEGEGTKVRSWVSGNMRYTETSFFRVVRELQVDFDKIPVDASVAMDDSIMDLMEPYGYQALEKFQEKYMSGFFSEVFNASPEQLEPRAKQKAGKDSEALLQETLSGYQTLKTFRRNVNLKRDGLYYSLFPVWVYTYQYHNEKYIFYINGQTGKVIGKTPVSLSKTVGYGATVFAAAFTMLTLIRMLLEVIQ